MAYADKWLEWKKKHPETWFLNVLPRSKASLRDEIPQEMAHPLFLLLFWGAVCMYFRPRTQGLEIYEPVSREVSQLATWRGTLPLEILLIFFHPTSSSINKVRQVLCKLYGILIKPSCVRECCCELYPMWRYVHVRYPIVTFWHFVLSYIHVPWTFLELSLQHHLYHLQSPVFFELSIVTSVCIALKSIHLSDVSECADI